MDSGEVDLTVAVEVAVGAGGYEEGGDAIRIGLAANGVFDAPYRIGGGWCVCGCGYGFGLRVGSGGVETREEETVVVESRVQAESC